MWPCGRNRPRRIAQRRQESSALPRHIGRCDPLDGGPCGQSDQSVILLSSLPGSATAPRVYPSQRHETFYSSQGNLALFFCSSGASSAVLDRELGKGRARAVEDGYFRQRTNRRSCPSSRPTGSAPTGRNALTSSKLSRRSGHALCPVADDSRCCWVGLHLELPRIAVRRSATLPVHPSPRSDGS